MESLVSQSRNPDPGQRGWQYTPLHRLDWCKYCVPAIAAIFWAQTNLTKMVQRVGEFKLFHTCTRDALEVIAVLLIV